MLTNHQLTAEQISDFLKTRVTEVAAFPPFKKMTHRDGLFFVYDEDGKIKKATAHLHQALEAYNAL
jgi:hypothetical protein